MTRRSRLVVLSVAAALGGCMAQEGDVDRDTALDDAALGEDAAALEAGDRLAVDDPRAVVRPGRDRVRPQRESIGSFVELTECGDALCEGDEFCCNESCSICAPLVGGTCTMQLCEAPPQVGEACGDTACPIGEVCCEPACGQCAVDLDACPEIPCEGLEVVPCGDGYCGAGEACCNESCGLCAPIGETCPLMLCDVEPILGPVCGDTVCQLGQVCCNETCGICGQEDECPRFTCGPTAAADADDTTAAVR